MADFEVALSTESSGDNFCISLWDINSGMQLKAYKGGSCPSRCVSLLGKDYIMASQANKPIIHVWNMAKESILTKLICPGKVTAMTCSPDGVYCVAACGEKIYIWQVASGNLLALLSRHFQRVSCLKFTDDGSHFLSAGDDNLVMVWKMARVLSSSSSSLGTFDTTLCPRYTWSEHALPVTDIHCGCGGMRGHVITSSLDQTCKLYDLSSGELLCSFVFDVGVTAVAMDAAEQSLFAGCVDGSIYQVELFRRGMKNNIHVEKEEALIFNGHSKQVNSLAVSMDGALLLSGSEDQTARVWHVHSRQCLRVVNHKGAVTNSQIIQKPLYLENPPPKSSLPPIQPFKRHVHVPSQSREKHVTGSADAESNSNGVLLVLKGKLSEKSSLEKNRGTMAQHILGEVAKLEDQGAASGGKRQLSRRELEEELGNVKRVNRNFYKFAVEELMKEVHEAVDAT
ncbi:hypothetical protein OS493_019054 [Desmophyllum pertusum]|uniref:WD repeat-containing protein 18 n=1 Tax=Desmophyllum pertusum TaxID=174260 RepID=A0A9W9Z011_9CNID|nr:hypothetical protein OS493_019054 [Desmophyllum pertusum]